MKRKYLLFGTVLILPLLMMSICQGDVVMAEDVAGRGKVEFDIVDRPVGIKDPETLEDGDFGPVAKTEGPLRIDFAPSLTFQLGSISNKDTVYPAHAQLAKGKSGPRGQFVQVSDYRKDSYGWTLQLRQESQFQHTTQKEIQLNGAIISFDKAWTNSILGTDQSPNVSKDVIQMNNIGETYNLADAKQEHGSGTWSVVFGASKENTSGQSNTMTPLLDKDGKPQLDPEFGDKPIQTNNAVNLSIPGTTKKIPGTYTTVLTWILAELP